MKFNFTGTKYVQALKWVVMATPLAVGFYETIATPLGLPYTEAVVVIGGAVTVLAMGLIGIAKPDQAIANNEVPVCDTDYECLHCDEVDTENQ